MYSIEKCHLAKADDTTKALFRQFIDSIASFGPIQLEPLKSIIAIKKRSQFCSISVQKHALKVAFRMISNLTEPPNPRFNQTSHQLNWYYYEIYIRSPVDLDDECINWLRTAYEEN